MNITNIKQEQVVFLRNQDILSTSVRGVTTSSATGTLSNEDTITISVSAIKNIRSVEVDAVSKSLGTDYTVSYGISNTVITFTSNQSGDYSISYDHGSDKIYPDFPRDDLTIDSYPRIALDIINAPVEPFGIGGTTFISDVTFTIVVYADNSEDLDTYIQSIKDAYVNNAKEFYYLSFAFPNLIGPTLNSEEKRDQIMQKNIDIIGRFNVDE